jgi:MYXO-CTERM domain-containing protein
MFLRLILFLGLLSGLPVYSFPLYQNDFESLDVNGWSDGGAVLAPNGSTRFLGLFARNQATTFTLGGLTPGRPLLFQLDLYINRSWDGNTNAFGPDLFTVEVVGGPILLQTTFSNTDLPGFEQSFPDPWNPGSPAVNAPRAGASAVNTLGFATEGDTTYRLVLPVTPVSSVLELRFSGLNLQDFTDENWGIDNVMVETVVPEPSSGLLSLGGLGLLAGWRSYQRRRSYQRH